MITVNSSGNPLSAEFATATAQPSISYDMRLYADGSDTGTTIKDASIDLGAGETASEYQTFAPAQVLSTQFRAKLFDAPELTGSELEVRVGVDVGGSYEYVTVAYVTITEQSTWKGISEIKGVGRMGLMYAPHGLTTGDYSPSDLAAAISSASGVNVAVGGFTALQNVHVEEGGTCRDALESMCARLGGYACELGGSVNVSPYSAAATYEIPEDFITARPDVLDAYTVDGLTVTGANGAFSYGTGRTEIEDPTATEGTSAITWGNLQGYSYNPGSLKVALIDPRVTPADTISYGTYRIPARGISITYDGGYFGTYSAAGITAEAEEVLVEGPVASKAANALILAQEASTAAEATNQHFWHRSTDPNQDGAGTGAFVTDEEQDTFLQAIAQGTEPTEQRPLHNLLMNAEGILLRAAKKIRAAFTPSGVAFYDGQGNNAENIVASFGSAQFQIGFEGEAHLVGDSSSLKMVDKDSNTFFDVEDLRGPDGTADITDTFTGDSETTEFFLSFTADDEEYTVEVDGVAVTTGITKTTDSFEFSTPPTDGAAITATYSVSSIYAKAYTLGFRGSGNVGFMSVAEGNGTVASGTYSHAEGNNAKARGTYSHAEGDMTVAGKQCSHAEGQGSAAYGDYSHAEGQITIAEGTYSHAEGRNSWARGQGSHAEGLSTVASGRAAHAEGMDADANGARSHAAGFGTVANGDEQTAIGKYNVADTTSALIIGNGSSSARSNALTIDWSGDVVAAGDIEDGAGNVLSDKADSSALTDYLPLTGGSITGGITLGTPLPVASGGTGADNATDACAGINAARASNQSTQNVLFTPLSSASQTIGISYNVTNSSDSYHGNRLLFIIRDQGFSLYDSTNSTTEWQVTFPSGVTNFDVATSSPTLNSNATATNFDLRKQGSVVSLQVYQLKVAASLADAANVQIGSAIIPSAYRPKVNAYIPLTANVNGKGAGCFLYITTGGNVYIYNRSGSALGTGTNLQCTTAWIV